MHFKIKNIDCVKLNILNDEYKRTEIKVKKLISNFFVGKVCNHIFFIIIACTLLNAGYAQTFKGGFHIGLLATQVDGDDFSGYKKPGLFIGAFANVPFKEMFKFQLEIDYAQKGSRSPATSFYRYRIVLHQIEVPVLFGCKIWKEFSAEVGLSLNIIASAKEYKDNVLILPDDGSGCKFNLFEVGGIAGLNYMFKEHYSLFFRFNYSVSPLGTNVVLRDYKKFEKYTWNNAMLFGFCYQF